MARHLLAIAVLVAYHAVPAAITWLKGKRRTAIAGLLVSPVLWIGAIRLAKPTSPWARRYYRGDKLTRAWLRYASAGAEPAPRQGWRR